MEVFVSSRCSSCSVFVAKYCLQLVLSENRPKRRIPFFIFLWTKKERDMGGALLWLAPACEPHIIIGKKKKQRLFDTFLWFFDEWYTNILIYDFLFFLLNVCFSCWIFFIQSVYRNRNRGNENRQRIWFLGLVLKCATLVVHVCVWIQSTF